MQKVLLIFNNDPVETLVSGGTKILLESTESTAKEVIIALQNCAFDLDVAPLGPSPRTLANFFKRVSEASDDTVIFNLCEGAFGKSTLEMNVAALLEIQGKMFTGSNALTLGVALDKGLTKDILKSRSIPTALYRVTSSPDEPIGLGFPLIVKPSREDASLGIDSGAVVHDEKSLKERIAHVVETYKQPAIVEEYIDGREFNVAVMGNNESARALPPSEIEFLDFAPDAPKICSFDAKWLTGSDIYARTKPSCPANVSEEVAEQLKRVSIDAYRALGCRDYARIDTRMDKNGVVKVLEVNPNPDISMDAGFARAAKAAGLDYDAFIAEVVNTALKRYKQ